MTAPAISKWWSDLPWGRIVAGGIILISLIFTFAGLHGPGCLWRMMIHIPCPGCGLTRSIRALWHGNLVESFRYHPLGIPLVIGCIASLLTWPASRQKPVHPWLLRWGWPAVLILALCLWVVRLGLMWAGNTFFEW